jgi:hypothetical protein
MFGPLKFMDQATTRGRSAPAAHRDAGGSDMTVPANDPTPTWHRAEFTNPVAPVNLHDVIAGGSSQAGGVIRMGQRNGRAAAGRHCEQKARCNE